MVSLPFVSIIVPTKNRKEYLSRCLDRLIRQNYPHDSYEVIVVDDGSSDGTADWVRSLKETFGVGVLVIEKNGKGPAAARNAGIAASRGAIIGFTDDDVEVHEDWIASAVSILQTSKAAGVEGKTVNVPQEGSYYKAMLENITGGKFATCNIFYRKEILQAVGGLDETFVLPCREDSDLAFGILDAGHSIVFSGKVLCEHRMWSTSILGPLRYTRYLSHSAYLASKHPERSSFSEQILPSYLAMVALGPIAVFGAFLFGLPFLLLPLAAYLVFLGRMLKRGVHLGNVKGIGKKLAVIFVFALLPWVHTVQLLRNYVRLWLGRNPIG
jgi:glycosyltransferase involved in cell wall biosynthesis